MDYTEGPSGSQTKTKCQLFCLAAEKAESLHTKLTKGGEGERKKLTKGGKGGRQQLAGRMGAKYGS